MKGAAGICAGSPAGSERRGSGLGTDGRGGREESLIRRAAYHLEREVRARGRCPHRCSAFAPTIRRSHIAWTGRKLAPSTRVFTFEAEVALLKRAFCAETSAEPQRGRGFLEDRDPRRPIGARSSSCNARPGATKRRQARYEGTMETILIVDDVQTSRE